MAKSDLDNDELNDLCRMASGESQELLTPTEVLRLLKNLKSTPLK